MRPGLMFYVQHLLGIGHVVRASRVAAALNDLFDVTLVIGGRVPEGLLPSDVKTHHLPPVKAAPGSLGILLHDDGRPFGEAARAERAALLLGCFERLRPDVLLIEAFPFGRRQMRFELVPLLERARGLPQPPLIATSIRDILQQSKPERQAETLDLVARFFDRVLVHGDPDFIPLEASFPATAAFADKLDYTGLVGPAAPAAAAGETFDVIVSVGGGAVGARLIVAALAARPLCRLAKARWLVLTGPNLPPGILPETAEPGLVVRRFARDLPALLGRALLSVSQAGYNTFADLLAASCRAVLVPYAADGETEQSQRAARLAAGGRAVVVDDAGLDPARLAAALDQALDLDPAVLPVRADGAARTAVLLAEALERTLRDRSPIRAQVGRGHFSPREKASSPLLPPGEGVAAGDG